MFLEDRKHKRGVTVVGREQFPEQIIILCEDRLRYPAQSSNQEWVIAALNFTAPCRLQAFLPSQAIIKRLSKFQYGFLSLLPLILKAF